MYMYLHVDTYTKEHLEHLSSSSKFVSSKIMFIR